MRFGIRVDASAGSGLGHVKRCLALAHALRSRQADVLFITRDHGVDTAAVIRSEGFAAQVLPRGEAGIWSPTDAPRHAAWVGVPWALDATETAAALRAANHPVDWAIVDHYGLDANWHARVATDLRCRVCIIDDLADRPIGGHLLVDHNLEADHRAKYAAQGVGAQKVLGGPRYALLGPSYSEPLPCEVTDPVTSIGIFMGGMDDRNVSVMALRACRDHARFKGSIEIATTRANPNLPELISLCERDPGLRIAVDQPELSSFFARHGLQVGAGGGASWERCRIGAPTIAVVCADNQTGIVRELVARRIVRSPAEPSAAGLGQEISSLLNDLDARRQLSANARSLIDGRGAERVALALMSDALGLREATTPDAPLAHAWRSHEATRRYAWDAAPIALTHHLAWWERALTSARRRLLIAEIGGRPVGVFRLDLEGSTAVISLYLDPSLHGLGLGAAMLRVGQRWVREHAPGVVRLEGEVQAANHSSAAAFAAAGFARAGEVLWAWQATA